MGPCFHHRRRVDTIVRLAAVAVLTALFSAIAAQVASASKGKPPSGGQPPCPSCADRMPPTGSSGGGSGGTSGGAGQATAPLQPLISLGGITLNGNVASVTGSVNVGATVGAAVAAAANLKVTVNAKPIAISASGDFTASTNLEVNGRIVVRATDVSTGACFTITVPSSAIPQGGVEADALAQLEADKITLMLPIDGFTIVDGVGIDATVHVRATAGIAGLHLNGADLLASLKLGVSASSSSAAPAQSSGGRTAAPKPGVKHGSGSTSSGHHSASARVSGQAAKVSLTVTGMNGATQTTTVPVRHLRSVIRVGRQTSVSAFGALGVKIGSVKFDTHNVVRTGRVGVTVTVRDRRNYLVRDAIVMLQPSVRGLTVRSSWAGTSNLTGRATFTVPVSSALLGHRLYVRVTARTFRASTHVTSSAYLCGCG